MVLDLVAFLQMIDTAGFVDKLLAAMPHKQYGMQHKQYGMQKLQKMATMMLFMHKSNPMCCVLLTINKSIQTHQL